MACRPTKLVSRGSVTVGHEEAKVFDRPHVRFSSEAEIFFQKTTIGKNGDVSG